LKMLIPSKSVTAVRVLRRAAESLVIIECDCTELPPPCKP
jgi:hypothetical protein